jgi:hypothetical protein
VGRDGGVGFGRDFGWAERSEGSYTTNTGREREGGQADEGAMVFYHFRQSQGADGDFTGLPLARPLSSLRMSEQKG